MIQSLQLHSRVVTVDSARHPVVHILEHDKSVADAISTLCHSYNLMAHSYISVDELLARQLVKPPGCIVAEVKAYQPGASALLRRLKNAGVVLPVIMLSTDSSIAIAVSAIQEGVFDFLEKPFVSRSLLNRINSAIAKSTSK